MYQRSGKNDDGQTTSNLYYVTGTPADYKAYKNGSADASHTLLYDIFDAYLYDKTLLANGCVSVEFDARDGLVYSVLYSDRVEALSYTGCTSTMANIVNRSKENRKGSGSDNSTGLCFGYYGADSLSKAADTATKVKVLNASLHNEETLNLTWKLSKGETAVSLMNYQVMICDAKTNEELLEISFNNASLSGQKTEEGYYYSIPSESAEDELKVVAAEVTSFAGKKEEKLGTYPFLAYIDEELNVTLVLDAVDLSATQTAYETYRRTGEPGELMNTLSLHRLDWNNMVLMKSAVLCRAADQAIKLQGADKAILSLCILRVRMAKILMRTLVHRMKFKTQDIFITSVLQK